jgi:hypothetical protein
MLLQHISGCDASPPEAQTVVVPVNRRNPLHVGCKKLAPALASMDDQRMLHPFRALAPDLK